MCIGITQKQHRGHNGFKPVAANLVYSAVYQKIGVFRCRCRCVITDVSHRFCKRDCAKKQNLWTTVFAPMVLVQTVIGDHPFSRTLS